MASFKIDYEKSTVESLPCPTCGDTLTVEATSQQIWDFNHNKHIQNVFPELSPADRERFILGTCPTCWDKMFGGGPA